MLVKICYRIRMIFGRLSGMQDEKKNLNLKKSKSKIRKIFPKNQKIACNNMKNLEYRQTKLMKILAKNQKIVKNTKLR